MNKYTIDIKKFNDEKNRDSTKFSNIIDGLNKNVIELTKENQKLNEKNYKLNE